MAGEAPTGYSSGGMVTKLAAARIAMSAGCRMAIADGRRMNPLQAILDGGQCSWFLPASEPKTARKRWIAGVAEAERQASRSMPARSPRSNPAARCCRPASSGSRASSSAAMP